MLLKGGYGGFGNEHFKSSINTTPQESRQGQDGERGNFKVELELFADIGLIGLPNAGKSSLLNALTNSKAVVGDYPFTTLDPNLGDFYGYILADIPGLIEGASEGKGLGIKFLKHIKRTRMIAHLVSFENTGMITAYKEVRKELAKYDKKLKLGDDGLAEKDEIIILTKTDVAKDAKVVAKAIEKFSAFGRSTVGRKKIPASPAGRNKKVFVISLFDDSMVKKFSDELIKILNKKEK